jgi:hypothetical protein
MLLSLSIVRGVMRAVVSEVSVGPRNIRPRACEILYTNAPHTEAFVLGKHERKTFKKTKHLETRKIRLLEQDVFSSSLPFHLRLPQNK